MLSVIKKMFIFFVLTFLMIFSLDLSSASAAGSKFIIINKSNNQLAYYENSQLKKVFRVGTGRSQSLTPEGKFKIVNKIVNRPYYKDNIPGGDPRNPLGNRWLGLNARGTYGTTYAIHGNNNPNSIGGYVSSGCVRMFDNEVEWLFGQVPTNTPVIITSSGKSFDSIAASNGYKTTASTVSPSVPAMNNGSILKKGSRGPAVEDLQRKLTSLGFTTKGIDGAFGNNTDQAVRQFQKSRRLTVDGVVGPATRKALDGTKPPTTPDKPSTGTVSGTIKMGSRGTGVKILQSTLTAKGYNTKGVDGVFGSNTEKAVRSFQKSKNLSVDGIVGPATKKALGI
ncbi:L,D-transpeptidase family protein [Metabacillus idriensis]|uniref:L,D-transpeptidase family protein n=1 Tax=Metabacillus idriensis TaxID=324768 RepID=UPI001748DFD5|nr:peptidoglycan-binding protein [Metabacillus idriensis]